MAQESKVNIINAVSNWLKLLTLIVLVAEAFLVTVMTMIPAADPLRSWYPVLMVGLLLVIIVGLFYDRKHNRNSNTEQLKIGSGENELKFNAALLAGQSSAGSKDLFQDSLLGFSFEFADRNDWHAPQHMKYKEYLIHVGTAKEDEWENIRTSMSHNPVQRMMIESDVLLIRSGKSMLIEFDDESTTPGIENILSSVSKSRAAAGKPMTTDEIAALRKEITTEAAVFNSFSFENSFTIMRMNKAHGGIGIEEVNLPHVFITFQIFLKELMEELTSNKELILWRSHFKAQRVLIDGVKSDFTIYRTNALMVKGNNFYVIQIQWSPETNAAITVWEQLKKMFETFRLS